VRIVHEREVNKARYCPQNKTLIGAWRGARSVHGIRSVAWCARHTQRGE
jgi:hypothetical protein